mmetsp:Transcript_30795/g.47531  ORF Transcript_30795/g.47531 Transcript_30795/m.47531 type:complete len:84 (+) Transcript_30795:392-643(+)
MVKNDVEKTELTRKLQKGTVVDMDARLLSTDKHIQLLSSLAPGTGLARAGGGGGGAPGTHAPYPHLLSSSPILPRILLPYPPL